MNPNKTGETMSGSDMAEESQESVQVPVAALGGASEGDTVTFKVDSVDGDTATLSLAGEDESSENADNLNPKPSTISKAASLYSEGGAS